MYTYIVGPWDTLESIAYRFNVPAWMIMSVNAIRHPSVICPGMILSIPITDYYMRPEMPGMPASPDMGTMPSMPPMNPTLPAYTYPGMPQTPEMRPMPGMPQTPEMRPMPGMPQMPEMRPMPGMPQMPEMRPMPGMPQMPEMRPMPGMPQAPEMKPMPGMPQAPEMKPMPGMPQAPEMKPMPGMPQAPEMKPMPGMPQAPEMKPMPGMPVPPVESRLPTHPAGKVEPTPNPLPNKGKQDIAPPLGVVEYTVKPGDTVYQIAKKFNTTMYAIIRVNKLANPELIRPGQVLKIPQSPPEAIIYTIKPGDTLNKIAEQYNTSIENIIKFNYIVNPDKIYPGQQLIIPASLRD